MRKYYFQFESKHINQLIYKQKSRTILYLLLFVCGLSLTHHHTIILLSPAVIIAIYFYNKKCVFDRRTVINALMFFVLGLSIYLYIPIRAQSQPYFNWDDARTLDNFIRLVTRKDYGSFSLMRGEGEVYSLFEKYKFYLFSLWKQFNLIGITCALLGIYFLVNREKKLSIIFLISYLLTSFIFFILADVSRYTPAYIGMYERFYILPSLLFAIFIGLGIYFLQQWLMVFFKKLIYVYMMNTIIVIMLIISVILHFSEVNQRHVSLHYKYGFNMLSTFEKNALALTAGDVNLFSFDVLQQVYKFRKDVVVLNQNILTYGWYCLQIKKNHPQIIMPFECDRIPSDVINQILRANIDKRPVYMVGGLVDSSVYGKYRFFPIGLIYKIVDKDYQIDKEELAKINNKVWHQYDLSELKKPYRKTYFEYIIIQGYAEAHFFLASQYQNLGLQDLAIEEYKKTIELVPRADVYKMIGMIYKSNKHPELASYYLKTYIKMNPNDPENTSIASYIDEANKMA